MVRSEPGTRQKQLDEPLLAGAAGETSTKRTAHSMTLRKGCFMMCVFAAFLIAGAQLLGFEFATGSDTRFGAGVASPQFLAAEDPAQAPGHDEAFVMTGAGVRSSSSGRVFLHIADTHADPYYDYTHYWEAAPKICRNPDLFSNQSPAESCGKHGTSVEGILEHWNDTSMGRGGGPACPCGQFGANPPYSVLASLKPAIAEHNPEFVLWGGDFASHYEPGTNPQDGCDTAKNSAKATVTMVNAKFGTGSVAARKVQETGADIAHTGADRRIQHLWAWGNNDVLPKRQPLTQVWLEDFGQHLVEEGWLLGEEYETTWKAGGYYKRDLGRGLCAVILNSNSWTANQVNEEHHQNQLQWLAEDVFPDVGKPEGEEETSTATCREFLVSAHVPLGWLEGGQGHHEWTNLEGAEVTENSAKYREILDRHAKKIVAEVYGHINKADVRLMSETVNSDKKSAGKEDEEKVSDSPRSDPVGDIDEDTDDDPNIVSFTVAGISRRGLNDPQFQRITLEPELKHGISDISVYSMKRNACWENAFTFAYSFKSLFDPDFDSGINVDTLKQFVLHDKLQRERVESHLALSSLPYTKADLKDEAFLAAVRAGQLGC